MIKKVIIVVAAFLLLGLGPTPPVKAQKAISPSIAVNPGLVKEIIKPGETRTISLSLSNLGTDPIPMSASTINIARISDIGAPEFTSAPTPQSASDWLTVEQPEFILANSEKQEVKVKIAVPAATAPGGYSAALIFQAKLPSYYFDIDANAKILPALSVSFLISVGTGSFPTIDSSKISSFQTPRVVVSAPVSLITEIDNPTTFFIYANGEVTVTPAFGQSKQVSELKNSVMMPSAKRKYISAYTGSIWPGIYKATLRLGEGDQTVVASARFIAIPWQFLLIVGGLGIVIFFLLARRRFLRAWRILTKGDDLSRPNGSNRPIIR